MPLTRYGALALALPLLLLFFGNGAAAGDDAWSRRSGSPETPYVESKGVSVKPRTVPLRYDPRPSSFRVPSPPGFALFEKGQVGAKASLSINYLPAGSTQGDATCITWPENAKAAFTYSANVWASVLQSAVPIRIDACWASNLEVGVLGQAGATAGLRDFTGAPSAGTWYPIALANAIRGADLDTTISDISAAFSSTFDWYFGTDGNTPSTQVDFASVVMHEIGHGLGFAGLMDVDVDTGLGSWGLGSGFPATYDRFTENNAGQSLLNTSLFPNPSVALATQLQGGALFFDGTNANAANGGLRVPLYAPATWSPGSSYSHLAESFNGTANALMTFSLPAGESLHDPGPVVLGMLRDTGWSPSISTATLTVNIAGSGTVNSVPGGINCPSTCSAPFSAGTTVTLTASTNTGFSFVGWTGACTGTGSCVVTMDASKSVTAAFSTVATPYPLSVSKSGSGTVTSIPAGINCGVTCTAEFAPTTVVTLTAVADPGFTFAGLGGACTGTGTCTAVMNSGLTVMAAFASNLPRLANISTRGQVLTGENVMIGGFIIGGSAPKTVLVRARGPSMIPAGVLNTMANPQVVLVDQSTGAIVASNDNWADAPNAAAIVLTGKAPTIAAESAILVSLNPGAYTAVVSGVGGTTGVGIVEVFEIDAPTMPLTNISTRGRVLTGDDVMIGGFIIDGDAAKTVLIRARGPSMIPAGVTDALPNPQVTLVNQATATIIATNDDWADAPNVAAITATGLAPTNALESAILVTLPPGAYTAVVSGVGGLTGVGIVEVFAQ